MSYRYSDEHLLEVLKYFIYDGPAETSTALHSFMMEYGPIFRGNVPEDVYTKALTKFQPSDDDAKTENPQLNYAICLLLMYPKSKAAQDRVNDARTACEILNSLSDERYKKLASGFLGLSFYYGYDSGRDAKKARAVLEFADQNCKIVQYLFGMALFNDANCNEYEQLQNKQKGVRLLHASAQQGYAVAQYQLSKYYEVGKKFDFQVLVPRNTEKAAKWYTQAKQNGFSEAHALVYNDL